MPADARLIQARDLHVQQAALTGESLPAEKSAEHAPAPARSLADAPYMVLLGTSVVSGTATAVVTATGRATAFGDIVLRLATEPPEMEFERGIRRFGFLIMRTVIFLVLFVLVVNLAFHRPALESLLFAVALAVGLTPEFLPMITTVTLAQGALRMARRKVIVKHLPAIQNFGSIDILCSDKTGTLTERRDDARPMHRARLARRPSVCCCWPTSTAVRDGYPESARCRDPAADAARHSAATARSTRFPSISSAGGSRWSSTAEATNAC